MWLSVNKFGLARIGLIVIAIGIVCGAYSFSNQALLELEQNNLAFNFKVRERLLIGYMGVALTQLAQNSDAKERHAITIHFMTNVTRLEHLFGEAGIRIERHNASGISGAEKLSVKSVEILNRARALAIKADSESNTLDRKDPEVITMYNLVRAEIEKLDAEIYSFQEQHTDLIEKSKTIQSFVWIAGICAILLTALSTVLGRRAA